MSDHNKTEWLWDPPLTKTEHFCSQNANNETIRLWLQNSECYSLPFLRSARWWNDTRPQLTDGARALEMCGLCVETRRGFRHFTFILRNVTRTTPGEADSAWDRLYNEKCSKIAFMQLTNRLLKQEMFHINSLRKGRGIKGKCVLSKCLNDKGATLGHRQVEFFLCVFDSESEGLLFNIHFSYWISVSNFTLF